MIKVGVNISGVNTMSTMLFSADPITNWRSVFYPIRWHLVVRSFLRMVLIWSLIVLCYAATLNVFPSAVVCFECQPSSDWGQVQVKCFQMPWNVFKCYEVPSSGVSCLRIDAVRWACFGKIILLPVCGKIWTNCIWRILTTFPSQVKMGTGKAC